MRCSSPSEYIACTYYSASIDICPDKCKLCRTLHVHEGAYHDQVHQGLRKTVVLKGWKIKEDTNSTVSEVAPVFLQAGEFNRDI